MKTIGKAACIAALTISAAAGAHDFVCQRTIDGEVVHQVTDYPATVRVQVKVTNSHPTDASTALGVHDALADRLGLLLAPAAPFTLAVGQSQEYAWDLTLNSARECEALSSARACGENPMDVFRVDWDGGSAECRARLVCGAEVEGDGSCDASGANHHGLSFWKAHQGLVAACAARGPVDLGIAKVRTAADFEGILWGAAEQFADGTPRSKLDRSRFVLARELLVDTCNVRVLGAVWATSDQVDRALAALHGTACRDQQKLHLALALERDCDASRGVAVGSPAPDLAKAMAVDPTAPSGQSCTDEKGGSR